MHSSLFPYEPRPNQAEIMALISRTLHKGGHAVIESGTGSGKTVCALAPSLEYALKHRKKVLYLTRTNAQQRQVIMEIRAIAKRRRVYGLGLQGRHNTCLMARDDPKLQEGSSEELSKLCSEFKGRAMRGQEDGCRYFKALCACSMDEIWEWAHTHLPTIEEFMEHCTGLGICPYEANKALVPRAVVVTAPYVYFFEPKILNALLEWMSTPMEDLIVVVDEAHNLPEYGREVRSADLSLHTLGRAERETETYGDPELMSGTSCADLCRILQDLIAKIAKEYVIEDDGLVPPNMVEEMMMSALRVTSRHLMILWDEMITYGEMVAEHKRKAGRLPRSYVRAVGAFLQRWMTTDDVEYVKLVLGGDNPSIEMYALDPSNATKGLMRCHATLHISGTLAPLEEYRDSIGLPDGTEMARFPSPFPTEHRLILYSPEVTTKFEEISRDPELVERMRAQLRKIAEGVKKSTILFFPSFNVMSQFLGTHPNQTPGNLDGSPLTTILPTSAALARPVYIERQGMPQDSLMSLVQGFKGSEGALMCSVVGGRISEGLDFPAQELEVAVLVGIPYPKPTAKQKALLRYYDLKFDKGWEYTVKAPTARKMLQCVGRLIRSESDRGVAVILDKRAVHFMEQLGEIKETKDVVEDVRRFFGNCEKQGR
ncbi:MAG: ATP-dependent DNA helicase [Candidatus Thermoplasmatota archaeon]